MDRTLKSKRFLCQEHHVKRYGRHLQAVDAAKGQFKCKADSPCDPPSCPAQTFPFPSRSPALEGAEEKMKPYTDA